GKIAPQIMRMCSRRRRHSAGIDLSCVQTRWQFRTRVSHYGDSAQNIPSSGSGEPSAAHFPESSPPSPCGLRLDSLRSLRWEFMARACPAGAREAGFFRCPHNSENHKSAAKAGGPAGLESAISHERPILTIQAVRGRKGTRPQVQAHVELSPAWWHVSKLTWHPTQFGAPDTIRTCGLRLRRATLYPAELRVPACLRSAYAETSWV